MYHLRNGVTLAGAEEGFFGLFAKFGKPPGWRYGEWDFRPDWDYFGAEDDELEIRLDATKEAWQTGAPSAYSFTNITLCGCHLMLSPLSSL